MPGREGRGAGSSAAGEKHPFAGAVRRGAGAAKVRGTVAGSKAGSARRGTYNVRPGGFRSEAGALLGPPPSGLPGPRRSGGGLHHPVNRRESVIGATHYDEGVERKIISLKNAISKLFLSDERGFSPAFPKGIEVMLNKYDICDINYSRRDGYTIKFHGKSDGGADEKESLIREGILDRLSYATGVIFDGFRYVEGDLVYKISNLDERIDEMNLFNDSHGEVLFFAEFLKSLMLEATKGDSKFCDNIKIAKKKNIETGKEYLGVNVDGRGKFNGEVDDLFGRVFTDPYIKSVNNDLFKLTHHEDVGIGLHLNEGRFSQFLSANQSKFPRGQHKNNNINSIFRDFCVSLKGSHMMTLCADIPEDFKYEDGIFPVRSRAVLNNIAHSSTIHSHGISEECFNPDKTVCELSVGDLKFWHNMAWRYFNQHKDEEIPGDIRVFNIKYDKKNGGQGSSVGGFKRVDRTRKVRQADGSEVRQENKNDNFFSSGKKKFGGDHFEKWFLYDYRGDNMGWNSTSDSHPVPEQVLRLDAFRVFLLQKAFAVDFGLDRSSVPKTRGDTPRRPAVPRDRYDGGVLGVLDEEGGAPAPPAGRRLPPVPAVPDRDAAEREAAEKAAQAERAAADRAAQEAQAMAAAERAAAEAQRAREEAALQAEREAERARAEREAKEAAEAQARADAERAAAEAQARAAEAQRLADEKAARERAAAEERRVKEEADRAAQARAEREAKEAAERAVAEERRVKEAADRAAALAAQEAEAQARAEQEAAERAAAEAQRAREEAALQAEREAERARAEREAKEAAEREARERAAEQAEQEARDRAAREAADRAAAEAQARADAERARVEQAEREARAAAEQAERDRAEQEARAAQEAQARAAERAAAEAQARADAERAAQEARDRAAREAAEQAERDREAAERAAQEAQARAAERAAAEAQARAEQAEREAAAQAERDRAAREAADRAAAERAAAEAQRAREEAALQAERDRAAKEAAERAAAERAGVDKATQTFPDIPPARGLSISREVLQKIQEEKGVDKAGVIKGDVIRAQKSLKMEATPKYEKPIIDKNSLGGEGREDFSLLGVEVSEGKAYYSEFAGIELRKINFSRIDFFMSNFRNCILREVDFSKMDAKSFNSINFQNCDFYNCKIPRDAKVKNAGGVHESLAGDGTRFLTVFSNQLSEKESASEKLDWTTLPEHKRKIDPTRSLARIGVTGEGRVEIKMAVSGHVGEETGPSQFFERRKFIENSRNYKKLFPDTSKTSTRGM